MKNQGLEALVRDFLARAGRVRGAFAKIERGKRLVEEGSAELAELFDLPIKAPKSKKKGKGIEVSYEAPVIEIGDGGGDKAAVLAALPGDGEMKFAALQKKTGLSFHRTRAALKALRKDGEVKPQGKGRSSAWVRT